MKDRTEVDDKGHDINSELHKEEKDNSKKIIILIIIIIVILSLITSCGCTSQFFGELGASLSDSINNLFNKEEDFTIDDSTNDKDISSNKELKFDKDSFEVPLSDEDLKLSFSYTKIHPKSFTCSTSDAKIATCYVKDGYVIVNPKAVGTVRVTLQTTINGKIYQAVARVTVTDSEKSIDLSANAGVINLQEFNQRTIPYRLNGLAGDITVTSSDPSVAVGEIVDGVLIVTAFKPGTTTITLSIKYNGKEYTASYQLNVIDKVVNNGSGSEDNSSNQPGNNNPGSNGGNNSGNKPGNNEGDNSGNKPENPGNNGEDNPKPEVPKKEYTIRFEFSNYSVYIGESYDIRYIVEENGKEITNYDLNEISSFLSAYNNKNVIALKKGYITIIPMDAMLGHTIDLNVTYKGKSAKTTIKVSKYELSTYEHEYKMGFMNNSGERNIILNTNLFTAKSIEVSSSTENKQIQLYDKNRNFYVELFVDGNRDSGNIELEYTGGLIDSSSLPFRIKAHSTGTSFIHVVGKANGKVIAEFDIAIHVLPKYVVTIDANGGLFNEAENVYEFLLAPDEELDLSEFEEPYKMDKEACKLYKFVNYTNVENTIEYNRTDNKIIKNLTNNLTLHANYESTGEDVKEQKLKKKLWLGRNGEISLFYNEEWAKTHDETKVIYPGANGVYKMNFTNKSSDTIIITGMTLKEDTICVTEGCLNMGYIIKYSPSESNEWTYYYGNKNSTYWILNSHADTKKVTDNKFETNISFKDKTIEVKPGEQIVISLFWKWVDNDTIDTAIGEHAAEKLTNASINDMYGLSVGLDFETTIKACKKK